MMLSRRGSTKWGNWSDLASSIVSSALVETLVELSVI